MAQLTRAGALAVTTDMDRLASLLQFDYAALGIPERIASDAALRLDMLSDHVETYAVKLAGDEGAEADESDKDAEEVEDDKAAAKKSAKKAEDDDEALLAEMVKDESKKSASRQARRASRGKRADPGLSVEPDGNGFDANAIGVEVAGPDEMLTPAESWMKGHFNQERFQQLSGKQQGGDIGFFVSASVRHLRKLASLSRLSDLSDLLTFIGAKLAASDMADVKALAPSIKKMLDGVTKVKDSEITQSAAGEADPMVLVAADRIYQAVSETVPYLQDILVGVDESSPTAVLQYQQMVGGGSLKELLAVASDIVDAAVKSMAPAKDGAKKEARAAKRAEDADKDAEDEALLAEMVEDESKKSASRKRAEDAGKDEKAPDESDKDAKKEARSAKRAEEADESTEDADSEEGEASKKASASHGYNLFA